MDIAHVSKGGYCEFSLWCILLAKVVIYITKHKNIKKQKGLKII